jgi:hypothetical protein
MLGFSPLAAAPLADDGVVLDDGGIVAVDIQGGVPVVDALPLTQNHVFGADDITAQAPTVDTIAPTFIASIVVSDITTTPVVDGITFAQGHVFGADGITTGAPTFDDVTASIISNFDADEITLGAPTVDTATVAVISNFFPVALEPQPVVDALPFFQEYALTMVEITAGAPTLPARFTWDYQEPPTDSWTEQADDGSVWTTQADSSDTWTEATEPTDIWTDVTDPTDTWSEAA